MSDIKSEQIQKKKPSLPRRPRLRDWPMRGYQYHAEIIGEVPPWVEQMAEEMRRCWNDMCGELHRIVRPFKEESIALKVPDLSGEELKAAEMQIGKRRQEAIRPMRNTQHLRAIAQRYKGKLPSDCYYLVADRFMKAMQEWSARREKVRRIKGIAFFETGMPRFKSKKDTDLHLPLIYNACAGDETLFTHLFLDEGNVQLFRNDARTADGANMTFRVKQPLGTKTELEPVQLNVAFQRLPSMMWMDEQAQCEGKTKYESENEAKDALQLIKHQADDSRPLRTYYCEHCEYWHVGHFRENAIVKRISLIRSHNGFRDAWKVSFGLEVPHSPAREMTGRIAGCDSAGWRVLEDRIRVWVLTDSAGWSYEISLPLDMSGREERKDKFQENKINTWLQSFANDEAIGTAVQECKDKLREIYSRKKQQWPQAARKIMGGIVKMRQEGLRRLAELLKETDTEASAFLADWMVLDKSLYAKKRAFELRARNQKRDGWRQVATWIARNFDIVAWEGDLSLKQMAEKSTSDPALQNSQRYRQIADNSELRLFVRQAAEKYGCDLQDHPSAYSTRICPVCGGDIPKGRKLILTCENGCKQDQDCAASRYFLNNIEGVTSISANPVEIPSHLQRYLRVMSINETAIEVGNKQ